MTSHLPFRDFTVFPPYNTCEITFHKILFMSCSLGHRSALIEENLSTITTSRQNLYVHDIHQELLMITSRRSQAVLFHNAQLLNPTEEFRNTGIIHAIQKTGSRVVFAIMSGQLTLELGNIHGHVPLGFVDLLLTLVFRCRSRARDVI